MPSVSRDPLLGDLAAGNEPSFAALYDRLGVRLYRAAVTALGSPEDAEDAVQELFVSLVRSKSRLAQVEDFEAYLFVSLRRAILRCEAQRRRAPRSEDPAILDQRTACGPSTAGMGDEDLKRALAQLPSEQREVISLKIDGDLTFAQIGGVLGISPNTAASRYRYALEKLRAAMEELG